MDTSGFLSDETHPHQPEQVISEEELKELGEVFDKIKTHFPPAKVKKIIQTDDDIGKVSQATPVIAGRSLEFFLALLVKKSYDVAKEMECKRISGEVMKQTILQDEKFDFLREHICGEQPTERGDEEEEEEEEED
ncbi:hypothetical protein Kpol_1055p42 [Vanderwaltozyma polyspora DSM 70294]|uniref:Transcription factor CBF/NF-Y/archaeal histone domain-containing protein n=1 Tax=Vanderwaltozyma polyspora (strain ATCC 22028 / DSM 70294 / BCRC 21397 / CBS 2163 / NBRC 10782 / NRRL Y-8283 / UCD 57-17) TaxID=436907 RepID=A7TGB7_VANPO|nr:uncharacterized protein Kpol_1055p42 [Vanderwaltozyma polyspora DSM 70294]EDO18687.1 hypothetical protein Kpol_1055p42 [Vanderwaltozyma polyspora DSM 70294]